VLAARGEKPVASATLLTTLLDFTDTGILDVFIDEAFVKYREMEMGKGGLMKGQDLASTFSFLRPNDLVWNYVVGNYLKGETPPPFDLLYWNSDSTNLPGPYYAWYLRNTYLENNLVKPGKATVCGEKSTWARWTCRSTSTARAKTTSCPLAAPMPSTQHLARQEALCDGCLGPHCRRDQPAGQKQAQPLDSRRRQIAQDPGRLAGRCQEHPAAGGPTGRLAQEPRGQADCCAQDLWQGQSTRPSSPRRAATSRPRPDVRTPFSFQGFTLNWREKNHGRHRHRFSRPHRRGQVWRLPGQDPGTELGAASSSRSLLARTGLAADQMGEVIMGQVLAAGVGQNPARQAVIKSGLAKETPALTINAVCGSGLKAVMLAAQAVAWGDSEIVIAGGQENMSALAPRAAGQPRRPAHGRLEDDRLHDRGRPVGRVQPVPHGHHRRKRGQGLRHHPRHAGRAGPGQPAKGRCRAGRRQVCGRNRAVQHRPEEGRPIVFAADEFINRKTNAEALAGLRPAFDKAGA
jgi:hypothetical protein